MKERRLGGAGRGWRYMMLMPTFMNGMLKSTAAVLAVVMDKSAMAKSDPPFSGPSIISRIKPFH
jgi:hypothetical protein